MNSAPTRRARVLIAEDDSELLRLLAATLASDGYEVEEVTNGYDLLGRVSRISPPGQMLDLVISDIRMPYMTGLEVLSMLRRLGGQGWRTPVILITAFGDPETHAEAQRLGAEIFDKPFDLDLLRARALELASPTRPAGWRDGTS
ncbi:MAG: response regulator [Archangium sp.]|nr:response regulator [Archangium sp.]